MAGRALLGHPVEPVDSQSMNRQLVGLQVDQQADDVAGGAQGRPHWLMRSAPPASSAITRAIGGFCEARGPVESTWSKGLGAVRDGFHGDAEHFFEFPLAM